MLDFEARVSYENSGNEVGNFASYQEDGNGTAGRYI
jgi:hypothetical protein